MLAKYYEIHHSGSQLPEARDEVDTLNAESDEKGRLWDSPA